MDAKRRFLEKVLASGLEAGTVTTDDIVSHANAKVLAEELPIPLKAKLITAALAAKTMNTKLIVDTLGTVDLADNIPMRVLWACIAECAGRELGDSSAASKSPASKSGAASKPPAAPTSKLGEASASKSAESSAPKRAPTAPVAVPKSISGPKPNASAKAKGPDNGDASKRGPATGSAKSSKSRAATGSAKSSKSRATTSGRGGRSPTTPLVPRSEFDVDTDVGEDWGVDDIVEVVEETDLVSSDDTRLNDWHHDEETATRDNETKR